MRQRAENERQIAVEGKQQNEPEFKTNTNQVTFTRRKQTKGLQRVISKRSKQGTKHARTHSYTRWAPVNLLKTMLREETDIRGVSCAMMRLLTK